jgi:hypothetical protein
MCERTRAEHQGGGDDAHGETTDHCDSRLLMQSRIENHRCGDD